MICALEGGADMGSLAEPGSGSLAWAAQRFKQVQTEAAEERKKKSTSCPTVRRSTIQKPRSWNINNNN